MYKEKSVCVVIPAYNEESQILQVLSSIPEFVDRIVVVNDNSSDKTADVVLKYINDDISEKEKFLPVKNVIEKNKFNKASLIQENINEKELKYFVDSEVVNKAPEMDRVILINNKANGGVGASIARGYKWSKDYGMDCTAVMAGDGQMDPDELESIIKPVIEDGVDYTKGNRLIHSSAWLVIPKIRYFGNSILSVLTKIASGYWRVTDTQCGYTAISLKALKAIRIYDIYKTYGVPNDILVKLNIAYCTIKEIEIKPIYGVGEESKLKIAKVIHSISWLLLKSFMKRLWKKYLFRDFHPLFLLYHLAFLLGLVCIPYIVKVFNAIIYSQNLSFETLFAFTFLMLTSFQSLSFAMWMDIQDNERLYK